jgi:hypothetical protein
LTTLVALVASIVSPVSAPKIRTRWPTFRSSESKAWSIAVRSTFVLANVVETVNVAFSWKVVCAASELLPTTVRIGSVPAAPVRSTMWPSTMSVPPFHVPTPAST